jgi:hypothetical protein
MTSQEERMYAALGAALILSGVGFAAFAVMCPRWLI